MSILAPRSPPRIRTRRPSLPISPTLEPRSVAVPVPQRHGSISSGRSGRYGHACSFVEEGDGAWLNITAQEVLEHSAADWVEVSGNVLSESAVELLLQSQKSCLVVDKGAGEYGFFDYADLNAFLLLILQSRPSSSRQCAGICNLSLKSPFHSFPPTASLRTLLPAFASGVHRVAITTAPISILTDTALLEYLVTLDLGPLHHRVGVLYSQPAVSIRAKGSVLEAMQLMHAQGLSALGVLRPEAADDALTGVITAQQCAALVMPSEGNSVLGMDLEQALLALQRAEPDGTSRGEERFPVHTVTGDTTVLRAAHLILATSSARVFLQPSPDTPPLSPSASSSSLSDVSTLLSSNHVVSTLDIIAHLARVYRLKDAQWDLDPTGIRKRRQSMTLL